MDSNNCAPGLLTKGLGIGLDACTALIISQFRLGGKYEVHVVVTPHTGNVSAVSPLPIGAVSTFLQPIDGNKLSNILNPQPGLLHLPTSLIPKGYVKIVIKIRTTTFEREFLVPIHRGKIVVSVINVLNSTTSGIKMAINNWKQVRHGIKHAVHFFKKHKNNQGKK